MDSLGLHPFIEPTSGNRLTLFFRKLTSAESVVVQQALVKRGRLEFLKVHARPEAFAGLRLDPVGYRRARVFTNSRHGDSGAEELLVALSPLVDFKPGFVAHAGPRVDEGSRASIFVQFSQDGSAAFAQLTHASVGQRLAIAVDNQVLVAPTVRQEITTGNAVISGNFSMEEAAAIALAISAPLDVAPTLTPPTDF